MANRFLNTISVPTANPSEPAINFTNNTDTGIYLANNNAVCFASDGAGAMFVRNHSPALNVFTPRVGIGGQDNLTTGHALHVTTGTAATNSSANLKVFHLGETQDSGLSIKMSSNGTNADDKVYIESPGYATNKIILKAGEYDSTDGEVTLQQSFGQQIMSLNATFASNGFTGALNIGEHDNNMNATTFIAMAGNTGTYPVTLIGQSYNYTTFYNSSSSHRFAFIDAFGYMGTVADYNGAPVFVGKLGVGETAPTIAIDAGNETDAIKVPNGTTAQRPTGAAGMIRYNTTDGAFEAYTNSWGALGGSSEPTVGSSEIVINEANADKNFRVEGSTADMTAGLFYDAGESSLQVGLRSTSNISTLGSETKFKVWKTGSGAPYIAGESSAGTGASSWTFGKYYGSLYFNSNGSFLHKASPFGGAYQLVGTGILQVNGNSSSSAGNSYDLNMRQDSAAKPGGGSWTNSSDIRIKENIKDYTKGLNDIIKLKPKIFDYNGKGGYEKQKDVIGLIAQEVLPIFPESISTFMEKLEPSDNEKTELYDFNMHSVNIALINAVKELNNKIVELENKLNN